MLPSESRAAGKPANAGQVVSRCFSRGQLLPTEVGRFHACRQQCQSHAVPYCLLAGKDRRSLKSRNDLRIVCAWSTFFRCELTWTSRVRRHTPSFTDALEASYGQAAPIGRSSEYHTNTRRRAAERHELKTNTGVVCSAGTGCAGFKNGVVPNAHPN